MPVEDNPAWQLLARSKQFLLSARVLRDSGESVALLRGPILHLVGHGVEVFLKHSLVRKGQDIDVVKKKYGHDLKRLWKDMPDNRIRDQLQSCAQQAFDAARRSGQFDNEDWSSPVAKLDEYVEALSVLHGPDSAYTLRYIQPPGTMGPRPHLLIDTFLPVIDDQLRSWNGGADNGQGGH
jgi:hypothetical protein